MVICFVSATTYCILRRYLDIMVDITLRTAVLRAGDAGDRAGIVRIEEISYDRSRSAQRAGNGGHCLGSRTLCIIAAGIHDAPVAALMRANLITDYFTVCRVVISAEDQTTKNSDSSSTYSRKILR